MHPKILHSSCLPAGSHLHLLSALQVNVGAGSHPNKVKVYGPGVAKTGLKAHEPTYFTVDCTEAGQGKAYFGVHVPDGGTPLDPQPLFPVLHR